MRTMTAVSNARRATVATAEAFAVVVVAKLVSSSNGGVAVCRGTRTSDNVFALASGIIAVAVAAACHFKHCQ